MKIINDIRLLVNSQNLLSRGIRAGSILTLGSLAENILRFIRNIILTRLLAPDAFGLMATVMASVVVVEVFSEVGLKQSVIQNKRGAEESRAPECRAGKGRYPFPAGAQRLSAHRPRKGGAARVRRREKLRRQVPGALGRLEPGKGEGRVR